MVVTKVWDGQRHQCLANNMLPAKWEFGNWPTNWPTDQPTDQPTNQPTNQPTDYSSHVPTIQPTYKPTDHWCRGAKNLRDIRTIFKPDSNLKPDVMNLCFAPFTKFF